MAEQRPEACQRGRNSPRCAASSPPEPSARRKPWRAPPARLAADCHDAREPPSGATSHSNCSPILEVEVVPGPSGTSGAVECRPRFVALQPAGQATRPARRLRRPRAAWSGPRRGLPARLADTSGDGGSPASWPSPAPERHGDRRMPWSTNGVLPSPRSTTTCMHARGPCGVWIVAAYLRAIFVTVESCLPASVLSSEVSITQRSRSSR